MDGFKIGILAFAQVNLAYLSYNEAEYPPAIV